MRIVLDTNVLVSGLLSPYGPPGRIVRMVAVAEVTLCFDARIVSEYRTVLLRPKFGFDPAQVDALLEQIHAAGEVAGGTKLGARLPDPADEPFVEVALAGRAEYLVTGNRRHYPSRACHGIKVISPAEFLAAY